MKLLAFGHRWKNQSRLYRTFLFSTLPVSIPGGIVVALIAYTQDPCFYLEKLFFCLPTAGLAFDFLSKEMTQKETYFFYYNQGITKKRLWIVTFILMALLSFITYQITELCLHAWK